MIEQDLQLSAVFGLEPSSPQDNTFTRESLGEIVESVRGAIREIPGLRLFDVAPGLTREVTQALRTPLSGIALTAWNKRAEILKYGDTTRYPPSQTYEVWLHEHTLRQTIKPTVAVKVAGVQVARVVFKAAITATLHGAMLVIRGGKITHVRLGEVTTRAQLSCGRAELLKRDLKRWSLPGELPLADAIALRRSPVPSM